MPSVRTESQPITMAATTAIGSASSTASHHGQPRLTWGVPLAPKIATA